MTKSISRVGLVLLIATVIFSIGLTLWLLPQLGGPGIDVGKSSYTVHASFPDVQQLETKSVVLVRGVKVGTVKGIDVTGDEAKVTLEIEGKYAPVNRDAAVRIGQRTAIGDAYVDLLRGSRQAGELSSGAAIRRVRPTVEFDEAFTALDEPSRADAISLLETFGRGARSDETAGRWNATLAQLSRVVGELRGLSSALSGQEADIAGLVRGSRTVLQELGSREESLAELVASGRRTLEVFARRPADFADSLQEMSRLLPTARSALAHAEPLFHEARPLMADLRAVSPELRASFRDLGPTASAAERVLAGLPRFNKTALPFLRQARPVVDVARPFARELYPVLQNLVPMMRYLSPRGPELAAWFSNTLGFGLRGDSKGQWVRFLIFQEPASGVGLPPGAFDTNSYPRPGDAGAPASYRPGTYPRLVPFEAGG